MNTGYQLVVKGLLNANQGKNSHWNASVNTYTMTVLRSYMDLNKDIFQKIKAANQ
jgi:hypothetical protein